MPAFYHCMMETADFDIVLNFHGIGSPTRPLEEGEDVYWIAESFFLDILALVIACGRKVLLTFDDSNSSDIEIAAPHLHAKGLSGIFFVLTGRLDTPGSLATSEVLKLRELGMQIGSHGRDQVDWTLLDGTQRKIQMHGSRLALESLLGEPVNSVAITYGRYNRSVLRDLRSFGYTRMFTSDGGQLTSTEGLMPRTSVRNTMSLQDIEKILRGDETPMKTLRRKISMVKKSWM